MADFQANDDGTLYDKDRVAVYRLPSSGRIRVAVLLGDSRISMPPDTWQEIVEQIQDALDWLNTDGEAADG